MLIKDDLNQFFAHVAITIAMLLYLFVNNYIGQEVTDYDNHVILAV